MSTKRASVRVRVRVRLLVRLRVLGEKLMRSRIASTFYLTADIPFI